MGLRNRHSCMRHHQAITPAKILVRLADTSGAKQLQQYAAQTPGLFAAFGFGFGFVVPSGNLAKRFKDEMLGVEALAGFSFHDEDSLHGKQRMPTQIEKIVLG